MYKTFPIKIIYIFKAYWVFHHRDYTVLILLNKGETHIKVYCDMCDVLALNPCLMYNYREPKNKVALQLQSGFSITQ
jgi:hypothetical protein